MEKSQHSTNVRRILSQAALAAVLGLSAVGLTQCRVIDDTITGVDYTTQDFHGRSTCMRHCNEEFQKAMDKERDRHRAALRACEKCRGNDDRKACKRAEEKVHDRNKDKIEDQKRDCKRKCYNEGGGHGGH